MKEDLFKLWARRIPKYSEDFVYLFNSLSKKYGAEGERKISLGKNFSNNYELYIYAFFLGLYNNEFIPIPEDKKRKDFSHQIEHWGKKSTTILREDFTNLQEYMFAAVIAKTEDLDLLALERGEVTTNKIVTQLIRTMESYTNGGLTLIKEKLEDNENHFLSSTAFLEFILGDAYSDDRG